MTRMGLIGNILLTALTPVIWGSTYLVTTEFLPPDAPLLASVLRALPAGLILVLLGWQLPKGTWWWRATVLGILNIGAFFYFLFVAAYHLPGGVAALVMSCQPVIVLVLGAMLLNQRFQGVQLVACLIGALGVGLVVLNSAAALDVTGVVAGLAGSACMATGIVLAKRWGRPDGVSVLTYTGWQLAIGGAVLAPIALLTEPLPTEITTRNLIGFGYLGFFGALVSYAIWFRGIGRLPAISISFISLISPLSATLLGYLFLNQTLTALQLVGAAAVIAAIILTQPGIIPQRVPKVPQPSNT